MFSSSFINMEFRYPSFCYCAFPKSTEVASHRGDIHGLVTCKCGQEDYHTMKWTWDKDSAHPECYISGPDVTFHPVFSQGTSIIRGNKRLEPRSIHYWEIKIITSLSGTDVMFGIGTEKVNLNQYHFSFTSALGMTDQSWGFSYRGMKQHRGQVEKYGNRFRQGCIIGVYVDLIKGYLEFFINRKSLGIAYTNIPIDPNVKLYPMVCSTAAKSSIKLMNCTHQPDSLELNAMKAVSKRPALLSQVRAMPGFRSLLNSYWFLHPPTRYSRRSKQHELPLEDEVVLPRKARSYGVNEGVDLYSAYKFILMDIN